MRIAIGCDHAGFELKKHLVTVLGELGHHPLDNGTHGTAPVDYPDYAEAVAMAIRDGRADRGVLICGSGVGASVAANKLPGIRAGLCHDSYAAHQGVEHDDINVLVLGSRVLGRERHAARVRVEVTPGFLLAQRGKPVAIDGEGRCRHRARARCRPV